VAGILCSFGTQHKGAIMQQAKIAVAGATGRLGRHVVGVLGAEGHEVVPISRSAGVDVISGDGLADALTGADAIIDVTAGSSSEQRAATEFFATAAKNLQRAGERLAWPDVVFPSSGSRVHGGYGSAKSREQAVLQPGARGSCASPVPQLVGVLMDMGEAGRRDLPTGDAHPDHRRPHRRRGPCRDGHQPRSRVRGRPGGRILRGAGPGARGPA
jgi:hypothetical protein